MMKTLAGIFGMMMLLTSQNLRAQTQWSSPATVGSRPEVVLLYSYQWVTAGKGHQDLKIVCKNITTDKIKFKINYEVHFHSGDVERVASSNIIELKPGEVYDPQSVADWGGVYMRYFLTPTGGKYGAKEKWFQFGKDSYGTPLYSAIHSVMNMKITDFENLSQKEREEKEKLEKQKKEAEAKKQKEDEARKQKEEAAKKKTEEAKQISTTNTNSTKSTSTDDFWSDNNNKSGQKSTSTTKADKGGGLYEKDVDFIANSKFKNNLNGVKDGEYFTDDTGNYYKKELGGARKVDRNTYERQAANKIYAQMEHRETERKQRDADFKQNLNNVSNSFYVMSGVRQGMRDASSLDSNFETIQELNAAFSQKMREISQMSIQLQQASTQGIQAYSSALSSANPSGYDYSGTVSALGAIGSAIAANNEAKKAREELKRQREEQEAAINKRQLDVLVAIRNEIGKIYIEGGMPLSTHKITAPVLYVFAYNSNKNDWNKNQSVPMSISNVISIYRYSDGTYPYTSNVKRTFESAGIGNPVLMGYFTQKNEAEKYRNSLVELAPNAKFVLKEVEVKVKEQNSNSQSTTSSDVDFWGTKTADSKTKNNTDNNPSETDFWGTAVKNKKTEPKKTEQKQNDFWTN
ncbi:hypothetical protein [Kaistella sp.]|uniref:hypothetical protein n=1 Tax=Kaistella sp. TaxID=2782235 RepID=UPI003C414B6D